MLSIIVPKKKKFIKCDFCFFKFQVIRENWNLKYSACFVLCPLQVPGLDIPYAVSIVSKIRSPASNLLLLRNTDRDPSFSNRTNINAIPDKIGICIKPFHFNYDSVRIILFMYLIIFIQNFSFHTGFIFIGVH